MKEKDPGVYVPGLLMYSDFITVEEEALILSELDRGTWKKSIRARQVQHFGYEFNYKTQYVKRKHTPSHTIISRYKEWMIRCLVVCIVYIKQDKERSSISIDIAKHDFTLRRAV
jgi:hypothetical protein